MTTRWDFLRVSGLTLAGIAFRQSLFANLSTKQTGEFISRRPELVKHNFTSKATEETIQRIKPLMKDPKLAWMFENCFPNTLDTTVKFARKNGKPDTFVITGDIHAMWMRDSSAQVFSYLPFANKDAQLNLMLESVIRRQTDCILLDPYANAFNKEAAGSGWDKDQTKMIPELHERKWETDSLCYSIRLTYHYWKTTGNTTIFDDRWQRAMALICQTFTEQQRKDGTTPYTFTRETNTPGDTLLNKGYGSPVKPVGLICSSTDNHKIRYCLRTWRDTDANTGFIHESFHKDNPEKYTRK